MKTILRKINHMVDQVKQNTGVERHIQSVLQGLVLVGVVWLTNTANDNRFALGILGEKVTAIENRLVDMRDDNKDRFTRVQGNAVTRRIEMLEQEFRKHIDKSKYTGG